MKANEYCPICGSTGSHRSDCLTNIKSGSGNTLGCAVILLFIVAFWIGLGWLINHFIGENVHTFATLAYEWFRTIFNIK